MVKRRVVLTIILFFSFILNSSKPALAAGNSDLTCSQTDVTYSDVGDDGCINAGAHIQWSFTVNHPDGSPYDGEIMVRTTNVIGGGMGAYRLYDTDSSGTVSSSDQVIYGENATVYLGMPITYRLYEDGNIGKEIDPCRYTLPDLICEEEEEEEEEEGEQRFEICNQVPDPTQKGKCLTCFDQQGIWTAIGCIDTSSTQGIVGKLMTVGMSIAGGIALLMILAAAFLFATSEGEPKRTSEAKEILTSAIIGLIFIIFSVTILQFIGVNILKIPGFGE